MGRVLVADYSTSHAHQDVTQLGQMAKLNSLSAPTPHFDTGTTWGGKIEDRVKEVTFKCVSAYVDLVIYYASRRSLESYGIDFSKTKQIFAWPSAFGEKPTFCKVPEGYQG